MDDVTNRRAIVTFPQAPCWSRTPLVSEIFGIKVAGKQTHRQTHRHIDWQ